VWLRDGCDDDGGGGCDDDGGGGCDDDGGGGSGDGDGFTEPSLFAET